MTSPISQQLLTWFAEHSRPLPWRGNVTPYHVWVSEVMLQQTRVETVIPYYQRWIERFPDVSSLAQAPLDEVLRYWEGLGYYARARNLHRAAQLIVEKFGGSLPQDLQTLRKIPGIGDYTAAAIASIAFNIDTPTLDGNIRRVLARLDGLRIPIRSTEAEQHLLQLAQNLLPAGRAGDFNQALMELGALVCLPRNPACRLCPLAEHCVAKRNNWQSTLPVRAEKKPLPSITVTAAVICQENKVLIAQRPPHGLLGSLWEFPGGKLEENESLEHCLQRELLEELSLPVIVGSRLGIYHHAYTHYKVTLYAYFCQPINGSLPHPNENQDYRWVDTSELQFFPMGKIDRMIAGDLLKKEFTC